MPKKKKKQRSKSGKQKMPIPPRKVFANDQSQSNVQNKRIEQIAGVISGMADQVATDVLNKQSSEGEAFDVTPAHLNRRQQSQNALR